MKRNLFAVLIAGALFATGAAYGQTPTLAITVSGSTVVASGVTPNGNAVFFGTMHGRRGHKASAVRVERVINDSDGDGVVTLDLEQPIPYRSVFAVVDFMNGARGVGTPAGFPVIPLLDSSPVIDDGGHLKVRIDNPMVHIVVVRPGVGAWGQVLADGTPSDTDGESDGIVTGIANKSIAVAGYAASATTELLTGDVLILIDPFWAAIYGARVGVSQ